MYRYPRLCERVQWQLPWVRHVHIQWGGKIAKQSELFAILLDMSRNFFLSKMARTANKSYPPAGCKFFVCSMYRSAFSIQRWVFWLWACSCAGVQCLALRGLRCSVFSASNSRGRCAKCFIYVFFYLEMHMFFFARWKKRNLSCYGKNEQSNWRSHEKEPAIHKALIWKTN